MSIYAGSQAQSVKMEQRLDKWPLAARNRREDNKVRMPEHIGGQPDGIAIIA